MQEEDGDRFQQKNNLLTEVTGVGRNKLFNVVSKTFFKNKTNNPLNNKRVTNKTML